MAILSLSLSQWLTYWRDSKEAPNRCVVHVQLCASPLFIHTRVSVSSGNSIENTWNIMRPHRLCCWWCCLKYIYSTRKLRRDQMNEYECQCVCHSICFNCSFSHSPLFDLCFHLMFRVDFVHLHFCCHWCCCCCCCKKRLSKRKQMHISRIYYGVNCAHIAHKSVSL